MITLPMAPLTWGGFSASMVGDLLDCQRRGILKSFNVNAGTKPTFHMSFGSAFGEAVAALFMGKSLGYAFAIYHKYIDINISPGIEHKTFDTFCAHLIAAKKAVDVWLKDYEPVDTEVRYTVKVLTGKRFPLILAGALDMSLRNRSTGHYKVLDFKTTKSSWGSWATDPQVLVYTFLDYLAHPNRTYEVPSYWVHKFAVEHYLDVYNVEHTLPRALPHILNTLLASSAIALEDTSSCSINMKSCKRGYPCYYYESCWGDNKFNLVDIEDSRKFSKHIGVELTLSDIYARMASLEFTEPLEVNV